MASKELTPQELAELGIAPTADSSIPSMKASTLTEEEAKELFELQRPIAPSNTAFLADQTKRGIIEGSTMLGGITQPAEEALGGLFGMQVPTQEQTREALGAEMGYSGYRPTDAVQQIAGAAVKGAVDPINIMLPASTAVRAGKGAFGILTDLAKDLGLRIGTGAGAGAGAEQGKQIGEEMGGETGGLIGSVIGGGVGGLTAGGQQLATRVGTKTALNVILPSRRNAISASALKEADQSAYEAVQNVFKAAAEVDPEFATTVAREIAKSEAMGIDFPTAVLTGNNPVIQSAIATIAYKNPTAMGKFQRQYAEATDALRAKAEGMFGPAADAQGRIGAVAERKAKAIDRLVDPQLAAIEDNVRKQTSLVAKNFNEPDTVVRWNDILAGKVDPVSPEASALYKHTFDIAEKAGTVIQPEDYMGIAGYVKSIQDTEIFKSFPALVKVIDNTLGSVSRDGTPLSLEQFDSLKKEVNAALRSTRNEDTKRILTGLKQEVDGAMVASFPPEAAAAYKHADDLYAQGWHAREFAKVAIKDGKLDPKASIAWANDNLDALNRIPGLKERVGTPSQAVARMLQREGDLKVFKEQAMKDWLLDKMGKPPATIVNNFYKDPKFRADFIGKYGKSDAMGAMRSFVLDDMINNKVTFAEAIRDPKKSAAIRAAFGADVLHDVQNAVDLSQSLSKSVVDKIEFDISKGVPKDFLEKWTNVPVTQVASRFRNQVISKVQATIELVSKGVTKGVENATERKLAEALLDTKTLKKYVDEINAIQTGDAIDAAWWHKLYNRLGGTPVLAEVGYQGVKGAGIGASQGVME
jgi:hypothetical protein